MPPSPLLACRAGALAVLISSLVAAVSAQWNPYVLLGDSDILALDQPRVAVEFIRHTPNPQSMGPSFFNTFLLDTGASGVVVAGPAYSELVAEGYQTVANYYEQGIAGFTVMRVSQPYQVDYAGTSGIRNTLTGIRAMSNADFNIGSFGGIMGMPAMVGKTTTIDFTPWATGTDLFLYNDFSSAPPPSPTGHRYTVPLRLYEFPLTGQEHPGDPLPTSSPLPFLPTIMRHGNRAVAGESLLDTGAQLSVLSSATAFALGLDVSGDGTFDDEALDFIEVGGIGGTVFVPILEVNRMALQTNQGIDLAIDNMAMAIIDIDPAIQGIFGMDNLTAGWFDWLFGFGDPGYYRQVHFDFRDAANLRGEMVLDVLPEFDVVRQPEPILGDGNGDFRVTGADFTIWSDGFGHFNGDAQVSDGDYNGDGFVTGADFTTWSDNFGLFTPAGSGLNAETSGVSPERLAYLREHAPELAGQLAEVMARFGRQPQVVPEPASFAVALLAGLALASAALRRRATGG